MDACGLAALVVLLLASALLASPASGREVGEKPSSSEGGIVATVAAGGSSKSDGPKESRQSSAAAQEPKSNRRQEALPPVTASKDSKQQSSGEAEKQGKDGDGAQPSATSSLPPLPAQEKDVQKVSHPPPPEGLGSNGGGEAKGGTEREDTGSQGKEDATDKMKEAMENCDASHKCSFGEEFSACLQASTNASVGSFVIVLNKGQNDITVNVKEASKINIDKKPLHLAKGVFGQVAITYISPDGGEITLNDGNGDCVLRIWQSVSDWQQQFQQFAAYARLNPIFGVYIFVFTVVLVGGVCVCCKFARRRGNDGVPYQQLEMGAQAPNSSGADNTASTADGWEDGWDDDWDDEEAPARSSDRKPTSGVSANGLTLRSRTDGKDGWDVDWDD